MRVPALRLDDLLQADSLAARVDEACRAGDPSTPLVRNAVLAVLRDADARAMERVREWLVEDGSGRACAFRIAHVRDCIVRAAHHYAMAHVLRVANPSTGERIALVAVGGYGRGHLAPHSDLDLLFLLPGKATGSVERLVETVLYLLWDLKLSVGHATRTVPECISRAQDDMTIRTAILESRFLLGDEALHDELVARFDAEIVRHSAPEFIAAKLAERDERHRKAGRSRYVVEPDVKEGKGGLRDLQTLYWIGKYAFRVRSVEDLVPRVLSKRELSRFRRAQNFLWAVRAHMHFEAGREQDKLHFDVQPVIADRLGYSRHPGQKAVERFMRHYFLHAKAVGDLTRIFCAELEENQTKPGPISIGRVVRAFTHRPKPIADTPFVERNGRIDAADPDLFETDPACMVRIFAVAEREGILFHPDAMHAISRNLKRIDKAVRADPSAIDAFMAVLTSRRDPEGYLRKMNEAGVLGRFVPEFGRIVAQMQFSLYHHYTVDEHLIRSIGVSQEIDRKKACDEHPLACAIVDTLDHTVLRFALFMHDIAKGRPEDHSVAGARVAKRLGPRFGLSTTQTDLAAWLVREHLTMSETAQSRDLADFGTVADFAARMQTMDRMRHLLVLTVCDIKAVGPGVFNGWKGQLLRTLYAEAEPHLTGGFSSSPREERARTRREALVEALTREGAEDGARMSPSEAVRIAALHYPSYLLSTPLATQARHAHLVADADRTGEKLFTRAHIGDEAVTEIDVLAPDHPHLLAILAGACAASDAHIVGARIATMQDGRALDTLVVKRNFAEDRDEERRINRVRETIGDLLAGRDRVPQAVARRTKPQRPKAFQVEPVVRIDNDLSNIFTVIEVEGLDRPGILASIADALSELSLDIASAQITTYGEKIIDTFYVRDLFAQKVTGDARLRAVREALMRVLSPDVDVPFRATG